MVGLGKFLCRPQTGWYLYIWGVAGSYSVYIHITDVCYTSFLEAVVCVFIACLLLETEHTRNTILDTE